MNLSLSQATDFGMPSVKSVNQCITHFFLLRRQCFPGISFLSRQRSPSFGIFSGVRRLLLRLWWHPGVAHEFLESTGASGTPADDKLSPDSRSADGKIFSNE